MIDLDDDSLRGGVLGLVIALVEIIRDALKLQAFKRVEGGSLTDEEIERLGAALIDLDVAIEGIKEDYGITSTVQSVRDGLDDVVNEVINQFINPGRWKEEEGKQRKQIFGG